VATKTWRGGSKGEAGNAEIIKMQAHVGNLRLFKYVPPERIDILENEKIAFTPPDRFKDPFEFRLGITRSTARSQLKELIAQAELRAELGYKELSSRQRRKGRKEMFKLQHVTEQFQKSFQNTVQTFSWPLGILCLCGSNDSNLMWYHYADGHKGFVIELDCRHESIIRLGKPWEVEYVGKPPVFDHTKPAPEIFRFKPLYLKYEAERRILRPLSEFVPEINEHSSIDWLSRLTVDKHKSIVRLLSSLDWLHKSTIWLFKSPVLFLKSILRMHKSRNGLHGLITPPIQSTNRFVRFP
jgi:hypothetical protein